MPFPADTGYLPADKPWMMKLRFAELDQLLAPLSGAGIAVATHPEWNTPEAGRFARIHDPEGNAAELWEPPTG